MSLQKNLPPVDTIHAILRTDNGRSGSYISSVGIEAKLGMEFEIVTDKGSIKYLPFQKQILTKLKDQQEKGKWQDKTEPAPLMWGVKEEVAAFAESIFAGRMDSKLSSSEALEDLKVVEAMLKSAEAEGQPIYLARDTF
jgi:predicted dehydrogenase